MGSLKVIRDNIPAPAVDAALSGTGTADPGWRIDMTCSVIGDKRDYSIDNDAMQAFEHKLLDEKWMETVEDELRSMNEENSEDHSVFQTV